MSEVTFFVPCLNEEANIRGTLETIVAVVTDLGSTYEILVVDDGSTDETAAVVQRFQCEHPDVPLVLKRNPETLGLGYNYVASAAEATSDYYMLVNGDNPQPKESLAAILEKLCDADMVIPYFGDNDNRVFLRRAMSRLFVFLVNLVSGNSVRYYNGPVLHRRTNILRVQPRSHGFGYQAELITRLLAEGASYVEVEIVNTERQFGSTKAFRISNIASIALSFWRILVHRFRSGFSSPRRLAEDPSQQRSS